MEVEATAVLTGPDGEPRNISLFWDGGDVFKLRFGPDMVGEWSWAISSADAGLGSESGSFTCTESSLSGGVRAMAGYPYHFSRQDGTPWF